MISVLRPKIISVSRATDVPAFHGEWFIHTLRDGKVDWKNPFNGKVYTVMLDQVKAAVFWSKNPEPFIKYLDEVDQRIPAYYFQFTLNDYELEGLEPGVPPLSERLDTFRRLSERLGPDRVVWRFDPIIFTGEQTPGQPNELLGRIERIGDTLQGFTQRMTFSFARIEEYGKVQRRLKKLGISWSVPDREQRRTIVAALPEMTSEWGMSLHACAEEDDWSDLGVQPGRCVDDELLISMVDDREFLTFYRWENTLTGLERTGKPRVDPGQRKLCGCVVSKDIGEYNTCPHDCFYCYANR